MDLRVLLTTFATIFLAELGDKTQVAAFGLGATQRDLWAVALGTALALVLAALLGVFAGRWLGQHLDPRFIRMAGGGIFVLMGILMLMDKMPR